MRRRLLLLAFVVVWLGFPTVAQELERTSNASLLMRSAAFGSDIGPGICYTLHEVTPGRWVAYAQRGQRGSVTWAVDSCPMSGPNAGYVTFINGENERLMLDVLQIDTCYGISGDIRIGW